MSFNDISDLTIHQILSLCLGMRILTGYNYALSSEAQRDGGRGRAQGSSKVSRPQTAFKYYYKGNKMCTFQLGGEIPICIFICPLLVVLPL